MSTDKRRLPLPEKLPEFENARALWIGYEASRWLPFDPMLYLERSLHAGSTATLWDGGILYSEPDKANPEYEFLRGWHRGCPDASRMVAEALRDNPDIHEEHLRQCHRNIPD